MVVETAYRTCDPSVSVGIHQEELCEMSSLNRGVALSAPTVRPRVPPHVGGRDDEAEVAIEHIEDDLAAAQLVARDLVHGDAR